MPRPFNHKIVSSAEKWTIRSLYLHKGNGNSHGIIVASLSGFEDNGSENANKVQVCRLFSADSLKLVGSIKIDHDAFDLCTAMVPLQHEISDQNTCNLDKTYFKEVLVMVSTDNFLRVYDLHGEGALLSTVELPYNTFTGMKCITSIIQRDESSQIISSKCFIVNRNNNSRLVAIDWLSSERIIYNVPTIENVWSIAHGQLAGKGYLFLSNFQGKLTRINPDNGEQLVTQASTGGGVLRAITVFDDGAVSRGLRPVVITSCHALKLWDMESLSFLCTLEGHSAAVTKVLVCECDYFDPVVISCSFDKTIRIWSLITFSCISVLNGHTESILHLVVSSQGKYPTIVSGSEDKTVSVWSTDVSDSIHTWSYNQENVFGVTSIFIPGHNIAKYCFGKKLMNSNTISGEAMYQFIFTIHDSFDLTSSNICVWNAEDSLLLFEYTGQHKRQLMGISISISLDMIASTSFEECFVVVWKLTTGEVLHRLLPPTNLSSTFYWGVHIFHHNSSNKDLIVAGSQEGSILFWDANTYEHVKAIRLGRKPIRALNSYSYAYTNNGGDGASLNMNTELDLMHSFLYVGARDGLLVFLDPSRDSEWIMFSLNHNGEAVDSAIIFRVGDRHMICSATLNGSIKIYTWECDQLLRDEFNLSLYASISNASSIKTLFYFKVFDTNYLATGHSSGKISIWNLETKRIFKEFEGHDYIVMGIDSITLGSSLFLISVAVDRQIIMWDLHSLDPLFTLPSFGYCDSCFERDIHHNSKVFDPSRSEDSWVHMSQLLEKYGESVLAMGSHYFKRVIESEQHIDFLTKFLPRFPSVVLSRFMTDVNLDHTMRLTSLLEMATEKQLQTCVEAITNVWQELLKSPSISNLYSVQNIHVSVRLDKHELIALSKRFPLEYIELIRDIPLIPSHSQVIDGCQRINIKSGDSFHVCGASSYMPNLWRRFAEDKAHLFTGTVRVGAVAYFCPIRGCSDVDMLLSYIHVCDVTQSIYLFNSEVVMSAVRFAWESIGKRVHIRCIQMYMVFIAVFSAMNYSFSVIDCKAVSVHSMPSIVVSYLLHIATIGLDIYYLYEEALQCWQYQKLHHISTFKAISVHVSDIWNAMELCAYGSMLAGVCVRLWLCPISLATLISLAYRYRSSLEEPEEFSCMYWSQDSDIASGFLAVASVAMWFKCLYYLRAFHTTGHLVSMVLHVIHDVRHFLIILFMILIGFGQAFWILSMSEQDLTFGRMSKAIKTLITFTIGGTIFQFDGRSSALMGEALLLVFALIVNLFLMNTLTALMATTFEKIQGNGLAQWRLEQCRIMIEQLHLLSYSETRKLEQDLCGYIHILKRMEYTNSKGDEFFTRVSEVQRDTHRLLQHSQRIEAQVADIERHMSEQRQQGGFNGSQLLQYSPPRSTSGQFVQRGESLVGLSAEESANSHCLACAQLEHKADTLQTQLKEVKRRMKDQLSEKQKVIAGLEKALRSATGIDSEVPVMPLTRSRSSIKPSEPLK